MASVGSGDGEPEFQIAPMIDVLLVLLIFFMSITTSEILKIDKRIVLPISPNAKARDAEMFKHEVAINVRWDDAEKKSYLNVDDKEYSVILDLVPYLKGRRQADEKCRAVVRGDRNLPAIEIQKVMGLVGEAGIDDISFSASNK
jgi:biopolymer transport protein ExbD